MVFGVFGPALGRRSNSEGANSTLHGMPVFFRHFCQIPKFSKFLTFRRIHFLHPSEPGGGKNGFHAYFSASGGDKSQVADFQK